MSSQQSSAPRTVRPSVSRPSHQPPPYDSPEQTALETALENAIVVSSAATLGIHPDDPGGQHVVALTIADVRGVIRAAYRQGRASRG